MVSVSVEIGEGIEMFWKPLSIKGLPAAPVVVVPGAPVVGGTRGVGGGGAGMGIL